MTEASTLEIDFFSAENIDHLYGKLKKRLYLKKNQPEKSTFTIKKINPFASQHINELNNFEQVNGLNLFLYFSDEAVLLKDKTIGKNKEINNVEISLPLVNQLDHYSLELLKWLKRIKLNEYYCLTFTPGSKQYYITHYISLLEKWMANNPFKGKVFLIIPQNKKLIYADSFPQKSKSTNNDTHKQAIANQWNKFGFTEKAILITTCFIHGLSLHQFRQVISQLLKVKDQQEEKDKTDRKMQGFYMAKWEKNYDQILRDCQLTSIKNEGQPAKIGFKNQQDIEVYTNFIEEEYPIFLQEFFEMLINAVFPLLSNNYKDVLTGLIGMYAHLATNHKDYGHNLSPIDLMATLLAKENNTELKEELSVSLISELLLQAPLKHHALYAFNLIKKNHKNTTDLITILGSTSCGQSTVFCLTIWLAYIQSGNKEIQQKVFQDMLSHCLQNKSLAITYLKELKEQNWQIPFNAINQSPIQIPVYQLFLIYFLIENTESLSACENGEVLPANFILAEGLDFIMSNALDLLINDMMRIDNQQIISDKQPYALQATLLAEWYISLHQINGKTFQNLFPDLTDKLIIKITELPALQNRINKKQMIRCWQLRIQQLLEFAATLPHDQYQQLIALNTKRKIMMTLINKFRNL